MLIRLLQRRPAAAWTLVLLGWLFAVPSLAQRDARVEAFELEWLAAMESYERELETLAVGMRAPEHPAGQFVDRAVELREASLWPRADVWLLRHLDELLWPPQRKREMRAEWVQALLDRELDRLEGRAEEEALEPETVAHVELGLLELARATFEIPAGAGIQLANRALLGCDAAEVKGAALWALAQIQTEAGTSDLEAAWQEGDGYLTQVLEKCPDTPASVLAAPVLCDLMSRRYEAEYERWWSDLDETESAPDPELHPAKRWWPRFEGLSDRGVGPAVWWLIQNADSHTESDEQRRALRLELFDRIVQRHADELWLVDAISEADTMVDELSMGAVLELGARLLERSTQPSVRAVALYEMAGLASRDESDDVRVAYAVELLERLVREQPTHQLARAATARIFELKNLRIGSIAPEVVVPTLDGRELRLTDYRGRVLLVVFWGYGFGGTRSLASLLERFTEVMPEDRFTVLGANTDEISEALRERVREEGLGWDHVYLDGPSATWPATWGVNRYPTTFLLDEEGRILAKHLVGPALEQAIETALGLVSREAGPE